MNTRMVAIGSCLLLSSFVACSSDDGGGPGTTDAGVDSGSPQGGSGGSGGKAGSAGGGGTAVGEAGSGGGSAGMQYAVGGEVSGLAGSGLVLKLNDANDLAVSKDGSFTFDGKLAAGADYAVTVGTQPKDPVQACTVESGSGKIDKADITNVKVSCSTSTRTIGGTLTGVGGATVVLKNGSESLSLSADGKFAFKNAVKQGDAYAVTVQTQPSGRSCSVAQGSGKAGANNVENVSVSCYADLKLLAKARVGGVQLSWDNNGASAYNVYVSTDASCNWDNAGSCAGADHKDGVSSPYLWSGLTDGTVYYFQVRGSHPNDFVTRSAASGTRPNRAHVDLDVEAVATSAGTTYIGGKFTSIGAYTGAAVPVDAQTGLTTRIPGFPIIPGAVNAVVSDGNNGFFIGGDFGAVSGVSRLVHVKSDGSIDTNWKPEPSAVVSALAVSGSTLIVAGNFTSIGGQNRGHVAAYDITSGMLLSWNPGVDTPVFDVAVDSSTLYIAGEFAQVAGQPRARLAAFPLTNNVPGDLKADFHPDPEIGVITLYAASGKLYVSGYFETLNAMEKRKVAAFNAATGALLSDFTVTLGDGDRINAFALLGDKLYVGGSIRQINGKTRSHLAALDPNTGATLDEWVPAAGGEVKALAATGDKVYVGGVFGTIANMPRPGLAMVSAGGAGTLSAWDPRPDSGIESFVLSGDTLYALGNTSTYGAEPRSKLASFSGGTLTNWAPAVTGGNVAALAVAGTTVYAGGDFEAIGATPRRGAAAIDGSGAATAWNAQLDNSGSVYALAADSSRVYLGGDFTAAGGGARANLAALTLDTGNVVPGWMAPAPTGPVRALAVGANLLYVGGDFQQLGSTARDRLAALSSTGALDATWNPGANQPVRALAAAGDRVYVGGDFTQLASTARNRLGSVAADSGALDGWDPNLNGNVYGLTHAHASVFAVGEFTTVGPGPTPTTSQFLTAFSDANDQLTGYPQLGNKAFAVAADDNFVYVGGEFTTVGGVDCSHYCRIAH